MVTDRVQGTEDAEPSREIHRLGCRAANIYDTRSNSVHAQTGASIDLEGNTV